MNFQYIIDYYKVPAAIGRRVVVDGKPGVIVKDAGNYIGVHFDGEKASSVSPCHPTWRVEYGEMGPLPKVTRSQKRYQRYREYGDSFESFLDFCYWDADPERHWNRSYF